MANALRIPDIETKKRGVSQVPVSGPEQRRETRYRVDKSLQVFAEGIALPAHLVNESMHGFCIRVPLGCLHTGQIIRLCFAWGEVDARVIWTRQIGNGTEAGLFVP